MINGMRKRGSKASHKLLALQLKHIKPTVNVNTVQTQYMRLLLSDCWCCHARISVKEINTQDSSRSLLLLGLAQVLFLDNHQNTLCRDDPLTFVDVLWVTPRPNLCILSVTQSQTHIYLLATTVSTCKLKALSHTDLRDHWLHVPIYFAKPSNISA